MPCLEDLRDPSDLGAYNPEQLPQRASQIRRFLVDTLTYTGGHLGPAEPFFATLKRELL